MSDIKNKLKKYIMGINLLLTIITLSFFSVSCKKDHVKIGLLIDSSDNVYVNNVIEEIERNINSEYELIIKDAENSQSKQNEQFLSLIGEKVEVFVVSLVDRLVANTYVEKCRTLNSSIIFFNKEPIKDDIINYSKAYYVGYNIEKLGLYQSKMVQSLFINPNFLMPTYDLNVNNIIEVVGLKVNQGSQTSETMFEKCINDLRSKSFNIKIVATEYIATREEATEKMRKIYNDPKNIDAYGGRNIELVLTSNDEIALGVLDFIEEIKDQASYSPFIIISANMIEESESAINDTIYGTTKSECQLQGQIILDLIDNLLTSRNMIMSYVDCSSVLDDDNNTYCTDYEGRFIYIAGEAIYKKKSH